MSDNVKQFDGIVSNNVMLDPKVMLQNIIDDYGDNLLSVAVVLSYRTPMKNEETEVFGSDSAAEAALMFIHAANKLAQMAHGK